MGGCVHAGERAAHHRALQRSVWPLVSARARRLHVRAPLPCAALRHRACDARDPRGESGVRSSSRPRISARSRARRALESQRDFENERRWLTWDILSGALTPAHACWSYLLARRRQRARARAHLRESPCTPSIIGINHYITSERFLDERVERYALDEIGGNGREVYADVAQVQVPSLARAGIEALLRETWDRYRTPIAITECHMGCTREEQMRWLARGVARQLRDARDDGIDVRAVTSWALLGSYDWNSLVTRETEHYEVGGVRRAGAGAARHRVGDNGSRARDRRHVRASGARHAGMVASRHAAMLRAGDPSSSRMPKVRLGKRSSPSASVAVSRILPAAMLRAVVARSSSRAHGR